MVKKGSKGDEVFWILIDIKTKLKGWTFLTYYYFYVALTKQASFLQL